MTTLEKTESATGVAARDGILRLLASIGLTLLLIAIGPLLFERFGWISPVTNKSWLILLITGGGLVAKALVADIASGEFLWHKYGYDNCILTFGSALTALVVQMTSATDLFPGLSSVPLMSVFASLSKDPLMVRDIQLFVFFFLAVLATLLTARVSAAIKKGGTGGKDWLAFGNACIGVLFLGEYVLILIAKS